jgi:hypothetical protein
MLPGTGEHPRQGGSYEEGTGRRRVVHRA